MMHAPPSPRRPLAPLRRYRALLAALAVMLLAVVPHVTFAASMLHGIGQPSAAGTTMRHASAREAASGAQAAAACQEHASVEKHAAAAKPPCCIIGCGLIGFGSQVVEPSVVSIGHRLQPPAQLRGESALIEPAERPPPSA